MILVEGTFWPLVVVGAMPGSPVPGQPVTAVDEARLWTAGDLRLAVIIAGDPARSRAQREVFEWLRRHRDRLWRCASRVAWVFEDEPTRRQADCWLALAGDRLFRCEVTTFRSVQDAVCWLAAEDERYAG